MKLTKEEERIILEFREKNNSNKPIKSGVLKHDLVDRDCFNLSDFFETDEDFITFEELEHAIISAKNAAINTIYQIKAGSKFLCYMENGDDCWYDDVGHGVECMDDEWAKRHLKNITTL